MDAHPNAPELSSAEATALPPEVMAAEHRLVGDVVAGHAAAVLEHVRPEWLFEARNRRVLERAFTMLAEGREVDLVALCEGQERDFMLYASTVIDGSVGGTNVKPLARILQRDWKRRQALEVGLELSSNGASRDPAHIAKLADRLHGLADSGDGQGPRFTGRALTGRQMLDTNIPPMRSLVGADFMIEGGITLLVGHSGLGKTFLAMQLVQAVAQGSEWLDSFWTDPDGRPAGLLELEMPPASIRKRIQRLSGNWLREATYLCVQDVVVDLIERDTQNEIIAWIKSQRLALLVMDPVNSLHSLDENQASDMSRFMVACRRICSETGVHLVLLHHVNKVAVDLKTSEAMPRSVVLNMARGSGRLGNDPDNILGLLEAPGGRIRLVFAKTRHSESAADMYLTRGDTGYLERSEAVQTARSNETANKIEKYLLTRHSPVTLSEIAKAIKMSENGVKKRLDTMDEFVEVTLGRPKRYAIRTSALIGQCDFVSDSETRTNDDPFA